MPAIPRLSRHVVDAIALLVVIFVLIGFAVQGLWPDHGWNIPEWITASVIGVAFGTRMSGGEGA